MKARILTQSGFTMALCVANLGFCLCSGTIPALADDFKIDPSLTATPSHTSESLSPPEENLSKLAPLLTLHAPLPIDEGGDQMTRYLISVDNYKDFSADLFLPATYLKPLSERLNSSRAWVYIKDKDGNALQTFGTITNREQLKTLWFATERGATPPPQVFVDIWDRQRDIHFKSALLDVVPQPTATDQTKL